MTLVQYVGAGSYGYPGAGVFQAGETKDVPTSIAFQLRNNRSFKLLLQSEDYSRERYVSLLANVDVFSGYGSASVDIIRSLARKDYQIVVEEKLGYEPSGLPTEVAQFRGLQFEKLPEIQLIHTIADNFHLGTGRINVGWTMWETSKIPELLIWNGKKKFDNWTDKMNNHCDYIIVPSKHSKQVFEECGVTKPITVINYGIDGDEWPFREKPRNDIFTVVQYGDLTSRKGVLEAVDAFRLAFPTERDVRLVLKTHHGRLGAGDHNIPDFRDPRIIIYDEYWSRAHLKQFVSNADCFIWLSRGEGFGLPPLQAAAMGLPVVMTHNTGMAEFYDRRYFWGVEDESQSSAYPLPGDWWNPSVESAAQQLRNIYNNYSAAQRKAKLAAQYVRRRFNLERFGSELDTFLRGL